MDLKWPWVAVALGILVVVALVMFSLARRRHVSDDAYRIAHPHRITQLPRFRALARRQLFFAQWTTLAVLVTAAGAIWLAARPQATAVADDSRANRDIVLCLDASSSMFDEDVEVLRAYSEIAKTLRGERVSLVIWSEAAVTVFPLTDDEAFIQEQLAKAEQAMLAQEPAFFEGTFLGKRASAIGDGWVSCVDRFDQLDEDRGRAIVLASDNDPQGSAPIFSLAEAAEYANDRNVRVYGIGSPDLELADGPRREFKQSVEATGGTFSILAEPGSNEQIVDGIQALEARRTADPPQIVVEERPSAAIAVTGLGVLMLVGGWVTSFVTRQRSGDL